MESNNVQERNLISMFQKVISSWWIIFWGLSSGHQWVVFHVICSLGQMSVVDKVLLKNSSIPRWHDIWQRLAGHPHSALDCYQSCHLVQTQLWNSWIEYIHVLPLHSQAIHCSQIKHIHYFFFFLESLSLYFPDLTQLYS